MSPEIPLEMSHLSERLRSDFTGLLPEATSGTAQDRERNFLSRALAAFAVCKLAGVAPAEAVTSIVDGSGDGGLDAIYYTPVSHRLLILQSKYFADGQGEPSLGDVSKFRNGLEALLQGNFDYFSNNSVITARVSSLRTHFSDPSLQVRGILIYSGVHLVSEDRIQIFEELRRRFSQDSDYLMFQRFNLTSVHEWLTGIHDILGVDIDELTLHRPGYFPTPYETYYGLITLQELAQLQHRFGDQLIAANIRMYKGSTEVNDRIALTIRDNPEYFFYFNNGLTAYCSRIEQNNLDRANTEKKRLKILGFSIVNGAQTLGSVGSFGSGATATIPEGFVFLKIISLQSCTDERAFAQEITRNTNFQNQIGLCDFVALDEEQERIQAHLGLSAIFYHYKDSADEPSLDESNFTLKEATTALACLEQEPDFWSRVLSNRSSLWSQEIIYPQNTELPSRYRRLFRPDRSARTIWRAVQGQRVLIKRCQENGRASGTGKRKEFFENARWLLLHLIFLRMHPERGVSLTLAVDERDNIVRETDSVAEILWSAAESFGATRHFKSVFSSAEDCRRLKSTTLARLTRNTV